MKFVELSQEQEATIYAGAPSTETGLFYDVVYGVSYVLHVGSDLLAAWMMGASEGGYAYAKTGLK